MTAIASRRLRTSHVGVHALPMAPRVPLFRIPLDAETRRQVRSRRYRNHADHQVAEADFAEQVVAPCHRDGHGGGNAMENWGDIVFSAALGFKHGWCLHVARVGYGILTRVGWLWSGEDEPLPEDGVVDDVEDGWLLRNDANEAWRTLFAEDLGSVTVLQHRGSPVCRIRFIDADE